MPADIRRLAQEVLRNPMTVQVGTMEPVKAVSHALYPVATHLKTPLLLALLRQTDTESVLVFTRTKYKAKRLGEQLVNAGFRDGTHQILVATDIAARGIDVSQISHVINYDMPDTVEAYTHRIGRTGRAAKTGDAFTFVTDEDQDMVRAIERTLGGAVPRHRLPGFDYSVPAPSRDTEFARPPRMPQQRRAKPAPAPKGASKEAPAPAATPVHATPAPARRPAATPAPAPKRARPTRAPRPGKAPAAPASGARRHATG